MINTRNTTLNQRPKALNAIGMNIPIHVDFGMVGNPFMFVSNLSHSIIGGELVSVESGITRDFLINEGNDSVPFNIGGNLSNYLATSLNSTDNLRLTLSTPTTLALAFATYVGLVNFYIAIKVLNILTKQCSDLMEHTPSRLIGNTSLSLDLLGRDTASSRSHTVDSLKPNSEGCSGFIEDSASSGIDLRPTVITAVAVAVLYSMMLCYLNLY